MNNYKNDFTDLLIQLTETSGVSPRCLAQAAGVTVRSAQYWLSYANRKLPNLDTANKIDSFLKAKGQLLGVILEETRDRSPYISAFFRISELNLTLNPVNVYNEILVHPNSTPEEIAQYRKGFRVNRVREALSILLDKGLVKETRGTYQVVL